jgi:hypothetical protein
MITRSIGTVEFPITEILSKEIIVHSTEDMLDLLGEHSFSHLVLYDYNFPPGFFDLSTGFLGEVLQKLTNYQVQLAIIGNFDIYPSRVLKEFIAESNKANKYLFVSNIEEVASRWLTA